MPYCLSCGKLRDTDGGFCRQCRIDESVRKKSAAKREHARLMRDIKRNAAERRAPRRRGEDDIAQAMNS